jgi:hypothetical protein
MELLALWAGPPILWETIWPPINGHNLCAGEVKGILIYCL